MAVVMLAVMCVAMAFCMVSEAADGRKGYDVPIEVLGVVMTMDHTFQQQVAAGWGLPVEINGVQAKINLHVEDPQLKIEKEIEITETYMQQGMDAWLGYPLNGEAMGPVAAEMKNKGIFMLTEGNNMPNETMGMVTDERDGGLLGGKMFVEWWKANRPGETPYILVLDDPTSEAFQRKPDAFVEYLKENMPEAVIIGQQDADMEVEKAMNIVSTFILSNPQMNFVFCGVDSNAVGAMAAVESAKRDDISIAGCGGEDNILPYLYQPLTEKKGGYVFEVAYEKSPIELGHLMMTGACQLVMDFEHADYNIIDLGFTALSRDNVDDYVANKNSWLEKIGEPKLSFK
jgi:ribose transport system substrate-binding protein